MNQTSHFFLHCPLLDDKTITLLSTLYKVDCKLIETKEYSFIETLLFGNSLFDLKKTPSFFLNHPLITFYLLQDPKNLTLTSFNNYHYKYSCRSNRIHLSFQNYLIYFIYIQTQLLLHFFVTPRPCYNFLVPGDCNFQFTCYCIIFGEKKKLMTLDGCVSTVQYSCL